MHQITPDLQRLHRHRYTITLKRLETISESLKLLEQEHGVGLRWLPGTVEFEQAQKVLRERRYRCAVDSLERLVIQRLFELTKLGMSGIGA